MARPLWASKNTPGMGPQRRAHPVMQFDKSGKFLRAWPEFLGKKPHGLRVGPDGNIWTVDLEVHRVMKWTQEGRLLMNLGTAGVSW